MKTQFGLILILSVILVCCNNQNTDVIDDTTFSFEKPTIIDTVKTSHLKRFTLWLKSGDYYPIYIGANQDSIIVSHDANFEKYYVDYKLSKHFIIPDSSKLLLLVDTSSIVYEIINKDRIWEGETGEINTESYVSYPVILLNKINDTLLIGYGNQFPIILEALDSNTQWKPIEEKISFENENELKRIILPPNNIAITLVAISEGSFKTKLRLRYQNIFSQEFEGFINVEQFEYVSDSK